MTYPINIIKDILGRHIDEFVEKQKELIKSRVQLLCVLTVAAYIFSVTVELIITPKEFRIQEVPIGMILILGAVLMIVLTRASATLRAAKLNAYLFLVFMLLLLVKLCSFYADQASGLDSAYVFTLFLVSMTIPWLPGEILLVGILHAAAYSLFYASIKIYAMPKDSAAFGLSDFMGGLMYIAMSLVLCYIVRRKEAIRDAEDFVLMKDVEEKNEQIEKELELAMRIHKTLVPSSISNSKVEVAVSYMPVYYIGGDYAKFHFLDENRLIFMISDVTGHGVPAALLVNRIHAEFERFAKDGKEPGVLLEELDAFIKEDFEGTDMYLSAFCGLLDFKKMKMLYSNHGHPPQCIYRVRESIIQDLPAQTAMLGLPINSDGSYQDEIELEKGDRILLFTDGVTETVDPKGDQFGEDGLEGFLRKNHGLSPVVFNQKLLDELDIFSNGKFRDDIFILHMEVKAG
jgi:serine phosphatase RsbU (regulator of sigma subunit)